jgi:hypothetical protein
LNNGWNPSDCIDFFNRFRPLSRIIRRESEAFIFAISSIRNYILAYVRKSCKAYAEQAPVF